MRRLLDGSRSMDSAPTPVYVTVQLRGAVDCAVGLMVTRISRYMDKARPITSNPGPGCLLIELDGVEDAYLARTYVG